MLVLDTIVHETIWGGSRLSSFVKTGEKKIGHLYSVFCRKDVSNTIMNGKYKRKKLNEVYPLWKDDFQMDTQYFPLTIALTEADEDLSIQVHPNDMMASELENQVRGKRESWYFIEPPYTGYIVNGCKINDLTMCYKLIQEDDYSSVFNQIMIAKGDYMFVEPGTLHAISAGSLVYEIEEGADFTYRLFDYNRVDKDGKKRELHIDKAMRALDASLISEIKHYPESGIIEEETYRTKKLENITFYQNNSKTLECLTAIYGECMCDSVCVKNGRTVLLWPGEKITQMSLQLGFVATYRN